MKLNSTVWYGHDHVRYNIMLAFKNANGRFVEADHTYCSNINSG